MKVGILGGTFDPPHNGHLALARAALEKLGLDEVLFLPTSQNPMKGAPPQASPEDRLEMVRLLIEGEVGMSVSDVELSRAGVSYSVDTMAELQMARPESYWFLMGSDAVRSLPQWRNPQKLLRMCRIGVVIRPPATSSDVMGRIPAEYRARIDLFSMPTVDISSTQIRLRIKDGQRIGGWAPEPVVRYIEERGLYTGS